MIRTNRIEDRENRKGTDDGGRKTPRLNTLEGNPVQLGREGGAKKMNIEVSEDSDIEWEKRVVRIPPER